MKIHCSVTDRPIEPQTVFTMVEDHAHGGQSFFFGSVRARNAGRDVVAVEYDAAVPLAETVLREIAEEASTRWGGQFRISVFHRIGRLSLGEISVAIGVSSPHRDEAFGVSREIIEQIKIRAPIWKKEFYSDGASEWLKGHALCQHGTSLGPKVHAAVLAGGKSLRMGIDKRFLRVDGELFLDRALRLANEAVQGLGGQVFLSGDVQGRDCLPDLSPEIGPLGGLMSVFARLREENRLGGGWLLVLPVDMPFLDLKLLSRLVASVRSPVGEATRAYSYMGFELPFLIRCDEQTDKIVLRVGQDSRKHFRSLRALQEALGTSFLELPDDLREMMLNANTPADWRLTEKQR